MCFVSKDNNKDLVLFYCLETENWFKFQFTDSNNDLLANSSVFAVNKKNGKGDWIHFMMADNEFKYDRVVREYTQKELPEVLD